MLYNFSLILANLQPQALFQSDLGITTKTSKSLTVLEFGLSGYMLEITRAPSSVWPSLRMCSAVVASVLQAPTCPLQACPALSSSHPPQDSKQHQGLFISCPEQPVHREGMMMGPPNRPSTCQESPPVRRGYLHTEANPRGSGGREGHSLGVQRF